MDQGHDGRVGHPELVGRQPVGRELPRQEVPGRDDGLLPLGVAGQVEDRHALPPHPWHRTEAVGGRHEDGVGQVEREIEIVVAERRAGRGGDGLEEGRPHAGVVVVVEAVDLVEDEHGVPNAERCPASRDR